MFTVHLYLKNLSVDVFLYLVWLNSMIDLSVGDKCRRAKLRGDIITSYDDWDAF